MMFVRPADSTYQPVHMKLADRIPTGLDITHSIVRPQYKQAGTPAPVSDKELQIIIEQRRQFAQSYKHVVVDTQ